MTLPHLTDVPATLTLPPDERRGARLLLAFDHVGARPRRIPAHATSDELVLALLAERLHAHLDDDALADLNLTIEYQVPADEEGATLPLQVVLEIAEPIGLTLGREVTAIAARDPHLATSLARHLSGAFALHPLFTHEDAFETLTWLHWGGAETDEEWLEEMRYNYADDTDAGEDILALTAEQFAERFNLTYPSAARRALRWVEDRPPLALDAIVAAHPPLAPLASALAAPPERDRWRELAFTDLVALQQGSDAHGSEYFESDPALVLLTNHPDTDDLIGELLHERASYVMDGGGTPLPIGVVRLPDHEPTSVRAFLDRLDALARLLAHEDRILVALRDLAQGGDLR